MQKDINIIIGMAGAGTRFSQNGYIYPKFLTVYNGAPMIYHSVKSCKICGNIYFVVLEAHLREYKFLEKLLLGLGDEIIPIKTLTRGAAESLLLSESHIKNKDLPMLSINSDQYMNWDPTSFVDTLKANPNISFIPTIKSYRKDFSYVRELDGIIIEVREKKQISDTATMGYYHWAKTSDFFIDARTMIDNNVKDNNEFYMAPVYNFTIKRGLPVKKFDLGENKYFPVGVPWELLSVSQQQGFFD